MLLKQRGTVVLVASLLVARGTVASAGTWVPVAAPAPGSVNTMLLLSDGTVMAANTGGTAWFRLTPDSTGSYVNGTWSTRAPMQDTRLYFSSAVLMDGRVFVAGGEYGSGASKAEVYDPVADAWTPAPISTTLLNPIRNSPVTGTSQAFLDANCKITANGSVLITPVAPKTVGGSLLYTPSTNTWAQGPRIFRGSYQDEASWVKLADDTILTIDPFGTFSERYNPATNTWINDGIVPVSLYDSFGFELGAALQLPDGRAFFLGSTGHTAIYTPSGSTSPGSWAAGPDIPDAQGTPDAPAAMMANGKILCAVSPLPTSADHFPPPTSYYEYDSVANGFTRINGPTGLTDNNPTYIAAMLDLPDGNVLYSNMGAQLYVYQPDGAPLAAGKPAISSITANGDGSYHLIGTGLNGISEGAAYGDDLQMDSNYPLVRFVDLAGIVYYGRTYNWSRTSVQTGATPVTTEFVASPDMAAGMYSLVVVANGIASDPVGFAICAVSGDMNFDGVVDGLDIQPFVDCMLSGGCFGCADFDGGGTAATDVDAFVSALLGA